MKLFKRIICVACVIAAAFSSVTTLAKTEKYSDLNYDYACYEPVMRLSELEIINGYEDSTYRPWNNVTRAEFCKVVVAMLDKVTEAKSISQSSAFDDVNRVKWCIPYVNYLTSNGYIKGYADATFKPNDIITYAEAVTILCRILGYDEQSVGYSWPANYINQAEALGLDSNMNLGRNDSVTRAAMAIIADKALFTYVNGSSQITFLESIGFSVMEDEYIIATNNEDSSLKSDEVRLTGGKYTSLSESAFDLMGQKGTAVINKDKELVLFVPDSDKFVMDIVVTKVTGNTIEYKSKNSEKGTYTFSSDFEVYSGGNKMTFGAVSSRIGVGTAIKLYADRADEWDFAMILDDYQNITPVRATKNYTLSDTSLEGVEIDHNDLTVYKDNKTVTLADIEINDVIYYNTQTNTMDVYNKKITGVYNEAMPSKAYVTSVNVGGNIYNINQRVSTSSLDASQGSFEIGERVTLLLGENDEVCFAVELSENSTFNYGVLLKTYKETAQTGDKEGSSRTMASIFMADGNTYEYEVKGTYSLLVGELVEIKYEDGIASLKQVTSTNTYGDINYEKRTIGNKTFLKDAVIFNRISDKDDSKIDVEVVNFDTIGTTHITKDQLITSVSANAFGDIIALYVCDLPSSYQYGMFRGYQSSGSESSSGVYTIFSDSNTTDYQSDIRKNVSGAVAFKVSNGKITGIQQLNKIAASSSVNAVEGGRIMINSTIYTMADNVEIVDISNSTSYKTMSVSELSKRKVSSVTLYSDRTDKEEATIRLITVK